MQLFRAAAFVLTRYRPEYKSAYDGLQMESIIFAPLFSDAIQNLYNCSGMTPLEEVLEIYVNALSHRKVTPSVFDLYVSRHFGELRQEKIYVTSKDDKKFLQSVLKKTRGGKRRT